jgi:hypothetical protein
MLTAISGCAVGNQTRRSSEPSLAERCGLMLVALSAKIHPQPFEHYLDIPCVKRAVWNREAAARAVVLWQPDGTSNERRKNMFAARESCPFWKDLNLQVVQWNKNYRSNADELAFYFRGSLREESQFVVRTKVFGADRLGEATASMCGQSRACVKRGPSGPAIVASESCAVPGEDMDFTEAEAD